MPVNDSPWGKLTGSFGLGEMVAGFNSLGLNFALGVRSTTGMGDGPSLESVA